MEKRYSEEDYEDLMQKYLDLKHQQKTSKESEYRAALLDIKISLQSHIKAEEESIRFNLGDFYNYSEMLKSLLQYIYDLEYRLKRSL